MVPRKSASKIFHPKNSFQKKSLWYKHMNGDLLARWATIFHERYWISFEQYTLNKYNSWNYLTSAINNPAIHNAVKLLTPVFCIANISSNWVDGKLVKILLQVMFSTCQCFVFCYCCFKMLSLSLTGRCQSILLSVYKQTDKKHKHSCIM